MARDPEPTEPSFEQALVTHLRASTLQGLVREINALAPEARSALFDALSPPARAAFQELPGPFQWLETPLVNELVTAFEDRFGLESIERRLQYTVNQQLSVIHAWMLKLLSPETLFHQAATLYRFNFRGGMARTEEIRRGYARLSIWSHGMYGSWYGFAFPHWLRGALGLVGAVEPNVLHLPPETGFRHSYEVAWRE